MGLHVLIVDVGDIWFVLSTLSFQDGKPHGEPQRFHRGLHGDAALLPVILLEPDCVLFWDNLGVRELVHSQLVELVMCDENTRKIASDKCNRTITRRTRGAHDKCMCSSRSERQA
jgi:hypothetical protein